MGAGHGRRLELRGLLKLSVVVLVLGVLRALRMRIILTDQYLLFNDKYLSSRVRSSFG